MQTSDGSWRVTVDYCKLHQLMTPIVAAVSDAVSLVEQINMVPGMVEWFIKDSIMISLGRLKGWGSVL